MTTRERIEEIQRERERKYDSNARERREEIQ